EAEPEAYYGTFRVARVAVVRHRDAAEFDLALRFLCAVVPYFQDHEVERPAGRAIEVYLLRCCARPHRAVQLAEGRLARAAPASPVRLDPVEGDDLEPAGVGVAPMGPPHLYLAGRSEHHEIAITHRFVFQCAWNLVGCAAGA